jgi:hypothetical protein
MRIALERQKYNVYFEKYFINFMSNSTLGLWL